MLNSNSSLAKNSKISLFLRLQTRGEIFQLQLPVGMLNRYPAPKQLNIQANVAQVIVIAVTDLDSEADCGTCTGRAPGQSSSSSRTGTTRPMLLHPPPPCAQTEEAVSALISAPLGDTSTHSGTLRSPFHCCSQQSRSLMLLPPPMAISVDKKLFGCFQSCSSAG